jgi:hypothetical protein
MRRSSSLSISLLDERNEHTHNVRFLFLIVYRHCIHKDVYRLSPSLVTVVRCLVVKKKTGEIERKQIFFWGAGGRARQEENLPSVVRRFSLICVTWSSFDEIDSSVVLLVRQVSTRRRACQPEHAVKHQQINSES